LPLVLLGETGTGKEVAARRIHALSQRPGPFVAVNCGALAPNLVEAELFGHRRGAFTGATENRPGFARTAHRGTLFLDEIGDLPPAAQVTLLRLLQEGEVVPIGDSLPVPVDVRVLAATHRDLGGGRLREDLLARLSGLTVALPPLRERREDLGLLIAALLRRAGAGASIFTPEAARALLRHRWPQNVRELQMALQASVLLAAGGPVELGHLPPTVRSAAVDRPVPEELPLSEGEQGLRAELVAQLGAHAGNVAAVARAMGKGRMQIHRWLLRFGLDLRDYRRPDH
jgi:transcriptional regulator with PAS, ATPase and Fis domain